MVAGKKTKKQERVYSYRVTSPFGSCSRPSSLYQKIQKEMTLRYGWQHNEQSLGYVQKCLFFPERHPTKDTLRLLFHVRLS